MAFFWNTGRKKIFTRYGYTAASRAGFYASTVWRKLRKWHLDQHPLCYYCEKEGIKKGANIVDHIRPIPQDSNGYDYPDVSLDPDNLRSCCWKHHSQKTRGKIKKTLPRQGKALQRQMESD